MEVLSDYEGSIEYNSAAASTASRALQKHIQECNLSVRRHEAKNPSTQQAIQTELDDWGVDSIEDLHEIAHEEAAEAERPDEAYIEPEIQQFKKIFELLGEDMRPTEDVESEFAQITDTKERLRFLSSVPLADKVILLCGGSFPKQNSDFFERQLSYMQTMHGVYAAEHEQDDSGDENEDYGDSEDLGGWTTESTLLGIKRMTMQAAMIGTPEYGAYRMAEAMIGNGSVAACFPEIRGGYSGIGLREEKTIGAWNDIIDEYADIQARVAKRHPELTGANLEHVAVRRAARIFTDAAGYDDPNRGPQSPYTTSFHESVAWAQLGPAVRKRFLGAHRQAGMNFPNIGRFIGKSGHSLRYVSMQTERREAKSLISGLHGDGAYVFRDQSEEDRIVEEENNRGIEKAKARLAKESDRINHKYDKLVEKTRSEERRAAYEACRTAEIQKATQESEAEISRLETRTREELLDDLRSRIATLDSKLEKKKSVADQALDILFELDGRVAQWDDDAEEYYYLPNSIYQDAIDWVNKAPFGLIKRTHRRLRKGEESYDDVYKGAIVELVSKAAGNPEGVETRLGRLFADYEGADFDQSRKETAEYSRIQGLCHLSSETLERAKDEDEKGRERLSKLVRYALAAALKGVSPNSDALLMAVKTFRGDQEVDEDIIAKRASTINYFLNLRDRTSASDKVYEKATGDFGAETLDDVFERAHNPGLLARAISNGLSSNLEGVLQHQWLLYEYDNHRRRNQEVSQEVSLRHLAADAFPFSENESARYNWCSKHAFIHLDGDWGRQTIGKLIYTRLEAGVEKSLHDATQWLETFQIPATSYDVKEIKQRIAAGETIENLEDFRMRLIDTNEERRFLSRILTAPQDIRDRLKLSTKDQTINALFASPENVLIYKALTKISQDQQLDMDMLKEKVWSLFGAFYGEHIDGDGSSKPSMWRIDEDTFRRKVEEALAQMGEMPEQDSTERIGDIAQRLKGYGLNRKKYIDDTTSWLKKHTVSSARTLTKAWGDRAAALVAGVEDNASSIEKWQKNNALMQIFHNRNSQNEWQKFPFSEQELSTTLAPFTDELLRCYSAETTLTTLENLYYRINNPPTKDMPARRIAVGVNGDQSFVGEVLSATDPRGCTIGSDTGCCMTIGGASDSCIRCGYDKPNAGFFALYDTSRHLMAQSFFYINPNHPDVVVMDNIEANAGRDSGRIISLYQEFFQKYFEERFVNDPNWQIRQVNVGTQYGEVAKAQVARLSSTGIIPNPDDAVYSDARSDQRLLFALSDERIAELRSEAKPVKLGNEPEAFTPGHKPSIATAPLTTSQLPVLQDLEQRIYEGNSMVQYDDLDFAYSELTQPGVGDYSFLMYSQADATREAVGYCLAYEQESMTDPNYDGSVVYIADFGILPEAREGGMAAMSGFEELLRRLSSAGVEKVELDARKETSFRFFESPAGQRYLRRKGYAVTIHDRIEDFEDGEQTQLISLERIHN